MITHYLITAAKSAIGVTATDEAHAMRQAVAMGIGGVVVRVDRAMSEAEFNAATVPAKPVKSGFNVAFNLAMYAAKISLMRGNVDAAIDDTRLALRNANRMGCKARKRLAFRILNWLRAARSRDAATVNAMASAYLAL